MGGGGGVRGEGGGKSLGEEFCDVDPAWAGGVRAGEGGRGKILKVDVVRDEQGSC